jgi:hypothetical protein
MSIVGLAVAWMVTSLAEVHANMQNPEGARWLSSHGMLDEKSRAVSADNDASVRAFADAIFNIPRSFPRLPEPVESVLKDRLVRSEIAFSQGIQPGVHEDDIVRFVNSLAVKLKAPEYARTSTGQVRALRMKLILAAPAFMGRGATTGNMKVGESISPVLSPLQATHLILTLFEQKVINPDFQVPVEQWDRDQHQRDLKTAQRSQEVRKAGQSGQPASQLKTLVNPRHREIQDAISNGLSSMGLSDALTLSEEALRTLKIDQ